jgi:hypothetical protein
VNSTARPVLVRRFAAEAANFQIAVACVQGIAERWRGLCRSLVAEHSRHGLCVHVWPARIPATFTSGCFSFFGEIARPRRRPRHVLTDQCARPVRRAMDTRVGRKRYKVIADISSCESTDAIDARFRARNDGTAGATARYIRRANACATQIALAGVDCDADHLHAVGAHGGMYKADA